MEPKRPFSNLDWVATPQIVKQYIEHLKQTVFAFVAKVDLLEKRTEILEVQTKKNSQNSSKPPSSDSPFKKSKKKSKKRKRKRSGQKGHKGYKQAILEPTQVVPIIPDRCACSNWQLDAEKI